MFASVTSADSQGEFTHIPLTMITIWSEEGILDAKSHKYRPSNMTYSAIGAEYNTARRDDIIFDKVNADKCK